MKYKKITLVFFFIILILLDYFLTNIYKSIRNILLSDPRVPNRVYHHDLKINFQSYGIINEKVFTNSLGFRDFSSRVVDINSNNKVLLIGDSFTYGLFNNYEDSYAGLITKYYANKNIEVLNASSVSYSPIIYYKKIEYLINNIKLNINEVFLFIDISDVYDDLYRYELNIDDNVVDKDLATNNLIKNKKLEKIKNFISSNFTFSFYFLDFFNDIISPEEVSKQFWTINHRNSRWNWNEKYLNEAKEGLRLNGYYLDKIKKLLDEKSINLKIIIYPWPSDLFYRKQKTQHELYWENWSKKNNVKIYNFIQDFDYIKEFEDKKKLEIIKKLYHKNDMHFNKYGSSLFYEKIINFLND